VVNPVGEYVWDVKRLREIADSVCKKHNTMCYGSRDSDDIVLFGFTWVEGFYYVDPAECSRNLECVKGVFDMHFEVLKLVYEDKYAVYVDEELIDRAVSELLKLSSKI
jgi:hypothetical protein